MELFSRKKSHMFAEIRRTVRCINSPSGPTLANKDPRHERHVFLQVQHKQLRVPLFSCVTSSSHLFLKTDWRSALSLAVFTSDQRASTRQLHKCKVLFYNKSRLATRIRLQWRKQCKTNRKILFFLASLAFLKSITHGNLNPFRPRKRINIYLLLRKISKQNNCLLVRI